MLHCAAAAFCEDATSRRHDLSKPPTIRKAEPVLQRPVPVRTWRSPITPFLVVPILAAALSPGCSSSPPVAPVPADPIGTETPELHFTVRIDKPGRPGNGDLVAYLGEAVRSTATGDVTITRVYDENFDTIGFYLGSGATYRIRRTASGGEREPEFLGNHDSGTSIERICGVTGPFTVVRGL